MGLFSRLFGRGNNEQPPPSPDDEGAMVSLVVLSNTYVKLTVDGLLAVLDEIFPGQFLPPRQDNFVIDGAVPGATFLIQSTVPGARGTFMMHSVSGPYMEFSNFSDDVEVPQRDRAVSQACWMSIDLIRHHGNSGDDEPCRLIGSVLAKLAPADSAFLVHPATCATMEFDETVRRRLASGDQMFGSG
jgi:hypothetical protein